MSNASELIDEMIASTPDWRGEALARLRRIIHEADPGIVCTGAILKGRVRVTFAGGASLPDPHKLYNAALEGKRMRAIDFYEGDEIEEAALKDLICAAVERNLAMAKPAGKKK